MSQSRERLRRAKFKGMSQELFAWYLTVRYPAVFDGYLDSEFKRDVKTYQKVNNVEFDVFNIHNGQQVY